MEFSLKKKLDPKNKKMATVIAFLIIPLSGLITDIYIPSMPRMATELGQTDGAIQLTLTLFLVSYGLMQFISGSLVDSFGRFPLTIISLLVFIASTFVIISTKQIEMIYAMRIVQGIATGFIVVAKRAYFVDVFEGEERKKYLSMMSIVWSSAPVIAPFIGGYLESYFHWQANFYVLAIYGIIVLLLEFFFSGETVRQYSPFSTRSMMDAFKMMLRDRMFLYGLFICGFSYGTTMVFGLSGAFIVEHQLHFSPITAGYVALTMGLAWMVGGFIGKALVDRPFLPKLKIANALQIILIIGMILSASWIYNIYTLVTFAFLIHLCVGFTFNNYFAFLLGRFPSHAGVASGLSGGSNFIITSICSYSVVGFLHPKSQDSLGYSYLVIGILAMVILYVLIRPAGKNYSQLNITSK